MNQLDSKAKTNRNGNGSQLAGIDASDGAVAEQFQGEPMQEDQMQAEPAHTDSHFSLRSLRAEAEIYAISRTLEYTGWNRRRAAQLLSISYRGILYKIRQHNLTPGPGREVVVLGQTVKVE